MSRRLSLCICTMNRADDLRKCLASVGRSEAAPHEVIVSDDSPESRAGETREAVAEFPGVQYTEGPRRGLSANRNHCLDIVSGDLVAFVDDDVQLDPSFLRKGPEKYHEFSATAGSEIVLTGYEIRPEGAYYPGSLNFLGFYANSMQVQEKPEAICINATIFPVSLFSQARFDENILFGAEERDISLHATHRGYPIVFSDELVNYHYPSPVNRDIYRSTEIVSRVYFGLKRYWIYNRSFPRFTVFNLLVLANAMGHRMKKMRPREAFQVVGDFMKAWRLFLSGAPRHRTP